MLRTISILVLMLILAVCTVSAQTLTLDKCLDDLAEKGSLGPVVAVMRGPAPGTADLSSLEGLAKTFGLNHFEQDGIHILGPTECIHLYDLSEFFPKERPKSAVEPKQALLESLTPEQVRAFGTLGGLHFTDLSKEQQSLLTSIFTGTIRVVTPSGEVRLSAAPVEQVTITGSLDYYRVTVGDGADEYDCELYAQQDTDESPEYLMEVYPSAVLPVPDIPKPNGPNVLKPSHLDYERGELQKQAQFELRTSLKDVVAAAAKESGLPLFVGPGSEQVGLYVSAGSHSIGQVLKAVSRATGGTWRKVGDLFVYTLDTVGLGAFDRKVDDYWDLVRPATHYAEPAFDPQVSAKILLALPTAPETPFSLTQQQISDVIGRMVEGPSPDACRLPWESLTPEQQAIVSRACDDPGTTRPRPRHVRSDVTAEFTVHFPAIGDESTGQVPANHLWSWDPLNRRPAFPRSEFQTRAWPKGAKIPMPPDTRGLLCTISKSDTPATVVTSAQRYGFNTLLIRIFADGYTIFPSKQFPQLPDLKADDFLRNLVAVAHSKGMTVVGVVDVLRWSNDDDKHWLQRTPELMDRDVTGRTNTEWMECRATPGTDPIQERMAYGSAFDGNFVSPFQPAVREKLSALVGELASYDLDGVAFDHAAIIYPQPWEDGVRLVVPGQTGFNESARAAFVRTTGVDPVDIVGVNFGSVPVSTPLLPVAMGFDSCLELWREFYRTGCYSLLEILVDACHKAMPGIPVWWLDTYPDSDGADPGLPGVDKVVAWTCPDLFCHSIGAIDLVRITDSLDPLYMGSYIAALQKKTFPGMVGEDEIGSPPDKPINDIIFDFACSEARKTEFLKLLETAHPAKTR